MPHEIDNNRAMYARKPAWHRLGIVKEDGWFSADEALTALGMDEEVRFIPVSVNVDGQSVKSEDFFATVQWSREESRFRILGAGLAAGYGVVQPRDQFRFLDEVVGAIGGSHYEAVGNLRKGRQTFMLIDTGALVLDPNGIADKISKYILGVNSFDGSMAFRVKFTNIRVECANLLACALRGSGDKVVEGDWSTKHTRDIMNRVEAAQRTLGLYKEYNDLWEAQAETMIRTEMTDDTYSRLLVGLYEDVAKAKDGEFGDKDREELASVRLLYELGPANTNVYGTFWGGLQAVTEHFDWGAKVRGGRTTSQDEARFRRQMGESSAVNVKDMAWERFAAAAEDAKRVVVTV